MGRRGWIIGLLVVVGVGAAIVIVLLVTDGGDSQEQAQDDFCSSLTSLESSIQSLAALEPTSASKDDYESAVAQIGDDWDQVTSDAEELVDEDISTLESAWDDFSSTSDDVPDDASVTEALDAVSSSAQTFASTVQSTLTGPDCSSS